MKQTPDTTAPHADPAVANIKAIVDLEREAARKSSVGQRVAQEISRFIGSVFFVAFQVTALVAWVAWNLLAPARLQFDPYPFGLLTFIVSVEGVLISMFVLISQNRLSRQTDQRDHLNLQINLLAEQEITLLLKLVRRVAERLDVGPETEEEDRAEKLAEETNVNELVQRLRRELPDIDPK